MSAADEIVEIERQLEHVRGRLAAAREQLLPESRVGADGPGGGGFMREDVVMLNSRIGASLGIPEFEATVERLESRLRALRGGGAPPVPPNTGDA